MSNFDFPNQLLTSLLPRSGINGAMRKHLDELGQRFLVNTSNMLQQLSFQMLAKFFLSPFCS